MPSGNTVSPGHATPPPPMNPMLLASACLGSSAALNFLFAREDANEAPMVMPTQEFIQKLGGFAAIAGVGQPPEPPAAPGGSQPPALPAPPGGSQAPPPPATAPGAGQPPAPLAPSGGAQPPTPPAAPGGGEPPAPPAPPGGGQPPAPPGGGQPPTPPTHPGGGQPAAPTPPGGGQPTAPPATTRLLDGLTAERGTALHAVATHGDGVEFLNCAKFIDLRDEGLLLLPNKDGDTPLHCAARAGKSQMVSRLIQLSQRGNRLQILLRKENLLKETALHDAVRIGNRDIVISLLTADPELANYPKEGASPLYLAVSIGQHSIASTLHETSDGNHSYYGPHGQNALHAATLHGTGITQHILNWNSSLTTKRDDDGSTPLHFASSLRLSDGFEQLLIVNPAPLYQADNNGLFPIHVAAAVGAMNTISIILGIFPSSAALRTAQGQTFLHVAIEKRRLNVVSFVCKTQSLNWILNMRDNDGNTALHLAVQASGLRMFCILYGNKEVAISLANNNKETPLDISRSLIPRGVYYNWNGYKLIYRALKLDGAKHSSLRQDQIEEKYSRLLKPDDKIRVAEQMKESSQMLGIGSVLIATVAFGATFAVPGGFIADDHPNRGTPTLARRYTFDAYMVANALAFLCSSIATIGLCMYSGSPVVNLQSRQINLATSMFFMSSSVTSLSAAFALGVYMVLAPVAHGTAIVVCSLTPLIVLYRNMEFIIKLVVLTRAIHLRKGSFRALHWLVNRILFRLCMELWPFIIIFVWAAIARVIRKHQ